MKPSVLSDLENVNLFSSIDGLDLSWKQIKAFPEILNATPQLLGLILAGNLLSELTSTISTLVNLQHLDLSRNQFREFPNRIKYLTCLIDLDLSNNWLTSISESICELPHLSRLALFNNKLSMLPESIENLTDLAELGISNNCLSKLPDALVRLGHLQRLEANFNEIAALPEGIGQLSELQELYVSHNRLITLPNSIGDMAGLAHFECSHNRITSLPDSIGKLANLQILNLSNNQLSSLPAAIGELNSLRSLDLSRNQLKELPESLAELPNLSELCLEGNDDLNLPAEIMRSRNASAILDYYRRVRMGHRPLNEAKLILVGRGTVGKTSIVNRLRYNRFNVQEAKTEGILITEWKIYLDREEIRLNVWDFGGQEIMHATHQFFLTHRSLYLVVLSGREGNEDGDADYWLRLVESFAPESPIIVVLNKINEHPFDVTRSRLLSKYPTIRAFIETDCADGTGIEQLRKTIERQTDELEHLRDAFPASWFAIKDQLSSSKSDFLTYSDFRNFCSDHGETDPRAQDALANYLHNLGVVLNYAEDPRLNDTHVLNPHWVTRGIYSILNSNWLKANGGELHLNQLSSILDPIQYPTAMSRFILDLMRKFDLCFNFPEDNLHYLIPELLDKQEPDSIEPFKMEECVNFQYHYPILTEGLLPRFIVRTHRLSQNEPRWRSGVILKFENNTAIVTADPEDKKVFVSVSGLPSGRRRLLAIIRSDFEHIHQDMPSLKPQEMVPLPNHPEVVIPYKKLNAFEREGLRTFHEVIGDRVVELNVYDLLNGVDLDGRRERTVDEDKPPLRIFFSYARQDENLRSELENHLKILQRLNLIETWTDRDISAGEEWKSEINTGIENAQIILLLISSDFIASDYCYEIEMKRALERHESGEARVIPIILREVNWKLAPFAHLQPLPTSGRPIVNWGNRDSAWQSVSDGLIKVVEDIQGQ